MPRTITIIIHPAEPLPEAADAQEAALRWLRRPRREFGGVAPLEMLDTPAAARQVEALLRGLAAARSDGED